MNTQYLDPIFAVIADVDRRQCAWQLSCNKVRRQKAIVVDLQQAGGQLSLYRDNDLRVIDASHDSNVSYETDIDSMSPWFQGQHERCPPVCIEVSTKERIVVDPQLKDTISEDYHTARLSSGDGQIPSSPRLVLQSGPAIDGPEKGPVDVRESQSQDDLSGVFILLMLLDQDP